MLVYFGIGSNKDDRQKNIVKAIGELRKHQIFTKAVSTFCESESLVPPGSPSDWHVPYLNVVVEAETDLSPLDLLIACKEIEKDMGRTTGERFAPRVVDLDILLCGQRTFDEDGLKIPHPQLTHRSFVLDPLAQLCPRLKVPGTQKTVLELSRDSDQHLPMVMGILNLTPDSFSSGSNFKTLESFEEEIDLWLKENIDIIDLGAESTRPGAKTLTDLEEWTRLSPALETVIHKTKGLVIGPRISVDTYHPKTAEKAINLGATIINDVSGLRNPEMVNVVKDGDVDVIAVHNLGIPADRSIRIPDEEDPVDRICQWIEEQVSNWEKDGLDLSRIIVDPGIGFGKTANQSLIILKSIREFQKYGLRVMAGHSRKSFMSLFSTKNYKDRDFETLGASLKLVQQGIDLIRVHNPVAHRRALRAWSALQLRDGVL